MTAKSRPEAGLRTRGRAFWDHAAEEFELSPAESELLIEVCRHLDLLDALKDQIEEDGLSVTGSQGQVRSHPALSEIRAARLALGSMIAQLQLPDEDGQVVPTRRQVSARKAANVRWRPDTAKAGVRRGSA